MKKITLCLAAIAVLGLSGCASQKAWKYGPEAASNHPPIMDTSVIVTPFDDQRINENSNKYALYLIPLMPYGWQDLNTPEGVQIHANSGLWLWKPSEDMAKATAEEVENAKIFRETFFGNRASEADLLLKGSIKSSKYNGKLITYGLSAYGPALWWLGLPAASIDNELILNFKLVDQKNNLVLWEKDYQENVSKISSMYNLDSDFNYSEMLKKILLNVISDIKRNASSIQNKHSGSHLTY